MTFNLEVLRKRSKQAAQLPLSDFLNLPDKVEATLFFAC